VSYPDEPGSVSVTRPVSVLLIDDDETWVRTQRRLLERTSETLSVLTATSFEAARDALADTEPDCIVCDYQLGDGTGIDLLTEVRTTDTDRPFILVTGEGDEKVASEAISAHVTDYVRKMDIGQQPTRLVQRIESAVAADRTRRSLARERKQKQALLETVTDATTRSELGANVCEQLVDGGYACAWIAVLDDDGGVVPLSTAGDTDYLEAAIIPGTRPADCTEPALRALDGGEPVVDVLAAAERSEPVPDEWEAIAVDHGFRSVAAIPITHNDIRFGVLTVYGETAAVSDRERALLAEYADTVGYAFQTAAWKRTLLSSATATVEFTVTGGCHPLIDLVTALPEGSTLHSTTVIPRNDDELLYITAVDGTTEADLTEAVETTETVVSVDYYRTDDRDSIRCGLVTTSLAPEPRLVDAGASLSRTVLEDGRALITAAIGAKTTVQSCVDVLSELCDDGSVSTLWTTPDQPANAGARPVDELTERQRQVLELAIEAGYFERPRHNNTGELADALDISRATFTQHLRAAQRKLFVSGLHKR